MQTLLARAPALGEKRRRSVQFTGVLPDLACCGGVALVLFAFYWRFMGIGRPQLAYTFSDFTNVFWSFHQFNVQEWRAGRVPLWNNSIFAGQPNLAGMLAGVFYPLSIVDFLLSGHGNFMTGTYLRLWLDGCIVAWGMYLLAKRWTGDRLAGVFAAITAALSSDLTGFAASQMDQLEAFAWVPLGIYCLDRALSRERPWLFGWLGGWCFGVSILAGYPQMSLLVVPVALAVAFYRWKTRSATLVAMAGLAVLVAVAALSLSAIQLVPSVELLRESNRASGSVGMGTGYTARQLLGFVLPGADGDKGMYIGLLPLLFGAAGAGLPSQPRRALLWLAVGVIGVLIAMGENTPCTACSSSGPGSDSFVDRAEDIALAVMALCR